MARSGVYRLLSPPLSVSTILKQRYFSSSAALIARSSKSSKVFLSAGVKPVSNRSNFWHWKDCERWWSLCPLDVRKILTARPSSGSGCRMKKSFFSIWRTPMLTVGVASFNPSAISWIPQPGFVAAYSIRAWWDAEIWTSLGWEIPGPRRRSRLANFRNLFAAPSRFPSGLLNIFSFAN